MKITEKTALKNLENVLHDLGPDMAIAIKLHATVLDCIASMYEQYNRPLNKQERAKLCDITTTLVSSWIQLVKN